MPVNPRPGVIHLWRYRENRRNYSGYHLTADAAGCRSLSEGLEKLKKETSFRLSPPSPAVLRVPNNRNGAAAFSSYKTWWLIVAPESRFEFSVQGDVCTLSLSADQVSPIAEGVAEIARGGGDFSIGDGEENTLWFWRFGGSNEAP